MKKPNAKKRARVTQKIKKTDLLWQLTEICKGPIRLVINNHRNSYLTAKGALKQLAAKDSAFAAMTEGDMGQAMMDLDRIIELHFYPVNAETGYRIFGVDLVNMLQRAIAVTQADTGVEDIFASYIEQEINTTDAVLRMMDIVKCSINFSVNEHALVNGTTAEQHLAQMKEFNPEIEVQVGTKTWNAMIACNRVMAINISPSTPIGSYSTLNLNIQPIMVEFLKLAENEDKANTVAVQAEPTKHYFALHDSK